MINLRMQTTAALTGLRELLEEVIGYLTILLKDVQQLPEDLVESAKLLWRKSAKARACAGEVLAALGMTASYAAFIVAWFNEFPEAWRNGEGGWIFPQTAWYGLALALTFLLCVALYAQARTKRQQICRWG